MSQECQGGSIQKSRRMCVHRNTRGAEYTGELSTQGPSWEGQLSTSHFLTEERTPPPCSSWRYFRVGKTFKL
jgi:hypothetical protein